MTTFWSGKDAFGEFTGSFVLALGVLFLVFASKAKSLKLDTILKQRAFMGVGTFAAIMVGAMTAKTLGAHGQANPGVTLIVATIEAKKHGMDAFKQVPMLIGFQLLGAILAYIVFLVTMKLAGRIEEISTSFSWSSQKSAKTAKLEALGNIFWFLPIAAMYIGLQTKGQGVVSGTDLGGQLDFFQLLIIASFGKMILILVMGEIGHGNYNIMVWTAMFLTTITAQKGISKKEFIGEISGVITSLIVGILAGLIGFVAITIALIK